MKRPDGKPYNPNPPQPMDLPDHDGFKLARAHMGEWAQKKTTDEMMNFFVQKFAHEVFTGRLDYFEAENRLLACVRQMPEYYSYERAGAEFSAAIFRYEDEAARIERRIRAAIAPLFQHRAPAETIKQNAIAMNKGDLLSPADLTEILSSEYQKWKTNRPTTAPMTTANRQASR